MIVFLHCLYENLNKTIVPFLLFLFAVSKHARLPWSKLLWWLYLLLFQVHEDYDAMLNQTNIGHNNNKYYVIQVLKCGSLYYTWNRWGRVVSFGLCHIFSLLSFEHWWIQACRTAMDYSKRDNSRNKVVFVLLKVLYFEAVHRRSAARFFF